MDRASQLKTFPVWGMEREIHEQQTGTGHRGLKEEWGEDMMEKGIVGELVLRA